MTNKIKLIFTFTLVAIMSLVLIACGGKKPVTPVETNITITFDSQGGTNVASKTIDKGQKVTKPSDPTKDTYTFINWFKALTDETPFSFDTVLNADITLYAKWNANQTPTVESFTVSFNSNEGTPVATQSVKKDAKAEKPVNPTKAGYTFVAWQLNSTDYDFNASVTSNLVLVAKWEQNETPNVETFIVTFNSNEGTAVENQTINKDAKVEKPANPTKTGHKFIAWQLNGIDYDFETPVTQNITLSAVWELDETPVDPTKHSVTFDVDGGTEISEILVEDGKLLPAITNPTKDGYTFAGWYKDATLNETFNMETPVNSDLTLYAKWTKNSTEPTDTMEISIKPNVQETSDIKEGNINNYFSGISSGFTVVFSKNNSTVTSIFNNSAQQVRLYSGSGKGGQLTIKSDDTHEIIGVKIVTNQNPGMSINGLNFKDKSVEHEFSTAVEMIEIINTSTSTGSSSQLRITEIIITYRLK